MKESEEPNEYTIDINRKQYTFFCTDGEQHVQKLTAKLKQTIESLAEQEPGQILSNYAMKIALLLADEAVREETYRVDQQKELNEKLKPILFELDSILDSD